MTVLPHRRGLVCSLEFIIVNWKLHGAFQLVFKLFKFKCFHFPKNTIFHLGKGEYRSVNAILELISYIGVNMLYWNK